MVSVRPLWLRPLTAGGGGAAAGEEGPGRAAGRWVWTGSGPVDGPLPPRRPPQTSAGGPGVLGGQAEVPVCHLFSFLSCRC